MSVFLDGTKWDMSQVTASKNYVLESNILKYMVFILKQNSLVFFPSHHAVPCDEFGGTPTYKLQPY